MKFFMSLLVLILAMGLVAPAQAKKGGYVQAKGFASVPTHWEEGISGTQNLEVAPGFDVGVGYNFGVFGLRGQFFYTPMESVTRFGGFVGTVCLGLGPCLPAVSRPGVIQRDIDIYGFSIDGKIYPVQAFLPDTKIDPYLLVGAGGVFLDGVSSQVDKGLSGNFGFGVDLHVMPWLTLTVENSLRPLWTFDSCNSRIDECYAGSSDNIDALILYMVGAGLTVNF